MSILGRTVVLFGILGFSFCTLIRVVSGQQKGLARVHAAPAKQETRIEIYDALKLAVGRLRGKRQLSEPYRLDAIYHRTKTKWVFTFTRLPAMPGGDMIVTVSNDGHVEQTPGL